MQNIVCLIITKGEAKNVKMRQKCTFFCENLRMSKKNSNFARFFNKLVKLGSGLRGRKW